VKSRKRSETKAKSRGERWKHRALQKTSKGGLKGRFDKLKFTHGGRGGGRVTKERGCRVTRKKGAARKRKEEAHRPESRWGTIPPGEKCPWTGQATEPKKSKKTRGSSGAAQGGNLKCVNPGNALTKGLFEQPPCPDKKKKAGQAFQRRKGGEGGQKGRTERHHHGEGRSTVWGKRKKKRNPSADTTKITGISGNAIPRGHNPA